MGVVCEMHYITKLAQVQIPVLLLTYKLLSFAELHPDYWIISILWLNEEVFNLALLMITGIYLHLL